MNVSIPDNTTSTTTVATPATVTALLPDWSHRRIVIYWTLGFCGCCVGLIVATGCVALFLNMFLKATVVDVTLVGLLTTILYTSAFVATSIIGSYVFGANFDYANSRQHVANFFTQTNATTPP
jgi:hypothetical protein